MLDLHTQVVTFLRGLWGEGRVAAEVRLAAVVIGHLATALRTGASARRTELLAHADRLRAEAAVDLRRGLAAPPTIDRGPGLGRPGRRRARARPVGGR